MIEPYLLEIKEGKKMVCKIVQKIIECNSLQCSCHVFVKIKDTNLTYRLDLVKALILTHRPQIPSPAGPGRPSVNPPPGRLIGKHEMLE
jgi:hypothetical protein